MEGWSKVIDLVSIDCEVGWRWAMEALLNKYRVAFFRCQISCFRSRSWCRSGNCQSWSMCVSRPLPCLIEWLLPQSRYQNLSAQLRLTLRERTLDNPGGNHSIGTNLKVFNYSIKRNVFNISVPNPCIYKYTLGYGLPDIPARQLIPGHSYKTTRFGKSIEIVMI